LDCATTAAAFLKIITSLRGQGGRARFLEVAEAALE
jgi:hypothetical protein